MPLTLSKNLIDSISLNKKGKPVAIEISAEEYESIQALKLKMLQARAAQAKSDITAGNLKDGESFFEELTS